MADMFAALCAWDNLWCAYLRYVDDFVLFGDDKQRLCAWRAAIVERLRSLRLVVHEREAQVTPTRAGIPWLGFVVYPDRRLLKRRNAVNFTRRLERNIDAYRAGRISFAELDATVQGWINHVRYADTWGLREHIFSTHPITVPPRHRPTQAGEVSPHPLRRATIRSDRDPRDGAPSY